MVVKIKFCIQTDIDSFVKKTKMKKMLNQLIMLTKCETNVLNMP